MSAPIRIYTTLVCPYCIRAKMLLKERGLAYEEVDVSGDADVRAWLVKATGQRTVPQIFVGERSIGGFQELRELSRSGELDTMLSAAS